MAGTAQRTPLGSNRLRYVVHEEFFTDTMNEQCEVVITGIGVVSPIGIGNEPFCQSLRDGTSGIKPFTFPGAELLASGFGGSIEDFEGKAYVKPRKSLKVMCRVIQLGCASAELAMQDAGLEPGQTNPDRLGVVFGNEMLYGEAEDLADAVKACQEQDQFQYEQWGHEAMHHMYPLWLLKYLPNMTACHVGIRHDARSHSNSITMSDVSSLLAIIESIMVIQRGQADVMIAGGVGSRLGITQMLYRGEQGASQRRENPQGASRPFDLQRDGTVNGEGGATLILERGEHARARGATILGKIVGHSTNFAGAATPASLTNAIIASIQNARSQLPASRQTIGYVNAHGASTIDDDVKEARAIEHCLGQIPVTGLKSQFGNLGAGSGAVEMAASVLTLASGVIPRTLNYEFPDPACPVHVVAKPAQKSAEPTVLMLNHSSSGQATSVIVTAPD
ncbi:MAG: beta-ketoacyl-[acyl-carrier-protein] synthase family protein [Pirellulaceae bacterium]